jgi:hypothetical protein
MGWPFLLTPSYLGDERVVDLARRHCSGTEPNVGSVIRIEAIDEILTECIIHHGSEDLQILGDHFSWGIMLHSRMMGQIHRCRTTDSNDFAFGSILVAWFLERVPLLHPRILLVPTGPRELRLMRWAHVLARHGGGEGGHYFMTTVAHVWGQMPQVILRYPYVGMDYHHDPDMMLPPGEDWDQRGMSVYLCFMILIV